jgi:hypothetical protein
MTRAAICVLKCHEVVGAWRQHWQMAMCCRQLPKSTQATHDATQQAISHTLQLFDCGSCTITARRQTLHPGRKCLCQRCWRHASRCKGMHAPTRLTIPSSSSSSSAAAAAASSTPAWQDTQARLALCPTTPPQCVPHHSHHPSLAAPSRTPACPQCNRYVFGCKQP